jgi:hypothetical protein
MPAKKVAKPEQAEEKHPRRQQTDTERYLLQIDGQTKRSFKTPEAAQAMALEIKARFPISIYDSASCRSSNTGNSIRHPPAGTILKQDCRRFK